MDSAVHRCTRPENYARPKSALRPPGHRGTFSRAPQRATTTSTVARQRSASRISPCITSRTYDSVASALPTHVCELCKNLPLPC